LQTLRWKKEVVTVTTPTIETQKKDLPALETQVRVPETVPEFLEATRPRRTRRMALALLVTAGVVAAMVLAILRPWQAAEIEWTGDWKDLLTEETAAYTGDWKDLVTEETAAYTGDWKDTITEPAPFTGDWKDLVTN
jgi:hypothetical protein